MEIGIIGTGIAGLAMAKKLIAQNYQVVISNSRGGAALQDVAIKLGPLSRAGNNEEVAKTGIVILAVNWSAVNDVLIDLRQDLQNKILIDMTNPIENGAQVRLEYPSSLLIAELAPLALVVKAFNHFQESGIPMKTETANKKHVAFVAGDDESASQVVMDIIDRIGLKAVDLGNLEEGGRLIQPGGPLYSLNLINWIV